MISTKEDDTLLRKLKESDQAAFNAFYDKYWKQVFDTPYEWGWEFAIEGLRRAQI